ncbi:response regulator [Hymenobacter sp. BT186]|uniref:histidine kinase n=1 Tax=Hymenobacter telluris TaxID=2816474 RepID=A0A939F1A4_9BACT|nr:response regulator [Hymenobacter telluris]MBW3376979.1 response regulator [Hymenobacter norwichensis]
MLFRCLLALLFLLPAGSGQAQTVPARQFLKQFGPAEGLAAPFIYALAQDQQGYLWIGTAEGLVRYDGAEFRSYTTKEGLAEDFVTGLQLDSATGQLLVQHYQGGRSRQHGTAFRKLPPTPKPYPSPTDTAATAWQTRLAAQLPAGAVVQCTLLDTEGNRWLGTAGQGLWRLTDGHLTFFPVSPRPTVVFGAADLLQLGTTQGVQQVIPGPASVRLTPTAPGFRQEITALDGTKAGTLLGTAGQGLWLQVRGSFLTNNPKFRSSSQPVRLARLPADLRITALAPDQQQGLWVGTIGEGVWHLTADGRTEHYTTANGLLHNDIYTLLIDRRGRVWFGTHGTGVAMRQPNGRFVVYRLLPGGEDIAALHEDAAGRIWVGTEGDGVYCFEQGHFRQYTTRQGLPTNYCYGFLNQPNGNLLLLHRNALSCFDHRTRTFQLLTSPENPLVRDLLPNSLVADATNATWLASRTGLLRLSNPLHPANATPKLSIPVVEVDGEPRRAPDFAGRTLAELPAKQHRVAFRFRAASLAPAGTWQYQHRLRGYVEDWSPPATQNETQFPRLDAGSYVFEVRARRGEQGAWSQPAAVSFGIATPFWRTWWFAALSAVAVMAGIWAFVRGREAVLRQQKFQLETTVRERTQELRQQKAHIEEMNAELTVARDVAEASRKAKAQFLANMSHEIRTPMNAVIGLSHLLRQTPLNAEQSDYLEAVQSSSQNLLVIINDILDSSKIEAGKMTLERTAFRLPELLRRVASMFRFATESKHLYFRLDIAPQVPAAVLGDPVRLNQVLVNLIGNAIKFTTTGGVTVRVSVVAATDTELPTVRFAVHDTGIGIPANKLDAIFEDFSQANTSTTRQFGGTGLGLSIARNLVELHGGRLWVESEDGIGSVFSFDIPYPAADPATIPAEASLAVGRFEPALRVLVAEDNEMNQLVARKTLEAWNVHVSIAANGRLAVQAAEVETFDAVLMDVQMPEMDGYEASRQLRALFPDAKQLPIIGLTASALPEDRALALEAGMNDTLAKPFDPALLFSRLAYYTDRTTVPAAPSVASAPPETLPSATVDWTLLEELAGGNETFIQQIVKTFLTQAPILEQQLTTAVSASDNSALARAAHKLKGQTAYFGVEYLQTTLEQLEQHAQQDALADVINTLVNQVQEQLALLYPELEARLAS